jgi:hypothetical protein
VSANGHGKGKERALNFEVDSGPSGYVQSEDENENGEMIPEEEEVDWDKFIQQPDDDEVEPSQGNASTSTSSENTAPSNPMRRRGPGKARSSIPTWLHANYTDTCERVKKEMVANPSGRPSCYNAGHFIEEPSAPIFSSACHAQVYPFIFYLPWYFIWLPHLFHRIPCLSCKSANCKTSKGVLFIFAS